MQTFLPYPNFQKCARVIDDKRLWKQILEADGIIRILEGRVNKKLYLYKNHPCVKMWKNYLQDLYDYRANFIQEWLNRRLINAPIIEKNEEPIWCAVWPDRKLYSSHRAALLAKNPEWYQQFGWKEEPKIEYFWPK
jgi:hypothetical protein